MFDRRSQFDRSFFDRTLAMGPPLPARMAGAFVVDTRTAMFTKTFRTEAFTIAERTSMFQVVATK